MRQPWFVIAGILLGMALAAPAALAGQEEAAPSVAPPTPTSVLSGDRVIVEWAPEASHADRVSARSDAEVEYRTGLGNRNFQLVEVQPGQTAGDAVRALEADPAVSVAERDSYSAPNAIPDDPLFGELWGLRNVGLGINGFVGAVAGDDINVSGAWLRTVGTPSTVIADLDAGYRFADSELSSVAWSNLADPPGGGDDDGNGIVDDSHGADFVGPSVNSPAIDGDPTDDNLIDGGHGVHTAGTMGAAGNNGVGITGVAQDVRIMPLRVCSYFTDPTPVPVDESGTLCPTSSQILAINYAGAHGARAANMSLGGTSSSAAVRDAIAANPQTLFVISAANDGQDNDSVPHYPCNYNPLAEGKSAVDNVICVAATDQADELASFSDWGATSVDLGAPGTETLSTYPGIEQSFHEDFQANDFATTWSQTGENGFGRAEAGDGPLTSFGMNDSPNEVPVPNSVHDVTLTTGVAIPAGSGSCRLIGLRYRDGGSGGTFYYQVLSDGSSAFFNSGSAATPSFAMTRFNTAPILGLAGHSIKLRFGFTAGEAPLTAANGIWFDDLEINCYKPVSAPLDYEFLQGTSMAAPHVTGAAGLLFSLKPSATVTEVRNALLSSVDPVASLAGKTVTGGRLDVSKALDVFDEQAPAAPVLSSTVPTSPAGDSHPKIVGSAEENSTVTLYAGASCGGASIAAGTAAELESPGIAVSVSSISTVQFSATATDTAENTSTCSAPISYTLVGGDEPPEAPLLISTAPASPSDENHPRILGSAEAGSTVTIYKGAKCAEPVAATGSAAELSSPGIAVSVPDNSTTEFSATATDAALNTSPCSSPISYSESSGKIVVDELPPGTVGAIEEAIKKASPPAIGGSPGRPVCTVPKLAGKTLGQAKAALTAAGCKLGAVAKPKAKKGHGASRLVVKSSTPAAGAKPASGIVSLKLGPKPKPRKHHH